MTENQIANIMLSKRPMVFRNSFGVKIDGVWRTFNIFKGSGDYLGWTSMIVTPDMIGRKIAVFTSCEIKTKKDKLSSDQRKWNRVVLRDGGICEVWKEQDGKIVVQTGIDIV